MIPFPLGAWIKPHTAGGGTWAYTGLLAGAQIRTSAGAGTYALDYNTIYATPQDWIDNSDTGNILHHFSGGGSPQSWTSGTDTYTANFNSSSTFRIQAYVGDYVGDSVYLLVEFLDASNNVIENLRIRGGSFWGGVDYKVDLYYGVAGYTPTTTGTYPQIQDATITFTGTHLVFTNNDSGYPTNKVNSHSVAMNTGAIAKVRVSDLKIRINHSGFYPNVMVRFGYPSTLSSWFSA